MVICKKIFYFWTLFWDFWWFFVWLLWLFVKLRRPVTCDRRIDLIGTVKWMRTSVKPATGMGLTVRGMVVGTENCILIHTRGSNIDYLKWLVQYWLFHWLFQYWLFTAVVSILIIWSTYSNIDYLKHLVQYWLFTALIWIMIIHSTYLNNDYSKQLFQ